MFEDEYNKRLYLDKIRTFIKEIHYQIIIR